MIAAAQIGMIREDIDTPVLLLDLDIMEQNIAAMADLIRRSPVALRPHAKTHKTPIIAHKQLAAGAIGITCRAGDGRSAKYISAINHANSLTRVTAERAMLEALDGSCRTPIGGLATLEGDRLTLRGLVAREDGSDVFETTRVGAAGDARRIGRDAGQELRHRASDDLFD